MCSRFLKSLRLPLRLCAFAGEILLLFIATSCVQHNPSPMATAAAPQFTRPAGVLRVCADPNNLPFSNERG